MDSNDNSSGFLMEQNISFDDDNDMFESSNITQDDIDFQRDLAILMTIGMDCHFALLINSYLTNFSL